MKIPLRIPYLSSIQVGLRRILMTIAVVLLSAYFFVLTPLFSNQVEKQVIAALEQATGARVHVREFHVSVFTRQIVMRDVSMRTSPKDVPFFSAESVIVQLRFATLFTAERELRLLRFQKPRVEVIFDAKGRSNLPQPGVTRTDPRRSPLDPLFNLAIRRLEVLDGIWIWDDDVRKIDFALERATASLSYDPARDRYTGTLAVRGMEKMVKQKDSFTWTSQMKFALERRQLNVSELVFSGPHSIVRAQVTVRDFRNPAITAGYQGNFDVKEAGQLLNLEALHEGRVAAKGSVRYDAKAGLHVSGDLRMEHGTLLSFHDLNGTSSYEATTQNLNFNALKMEVLGGHVDGKLRIEHLQGDPQFAVTGHVEGLTFARLAGELNELSPSELWGKVKLASVIGGEVSVGFNAKTGTDVAFTGSLSDPAGPTPGYIPVHGHTDMRLFTNDERLILHDTHLDTAGSHATAEGDGQFHVTLTTNNPREFDWLVHLPITIGQHAEIDGTLSGALRSPQFDGKVQLEHVLWPALGEDSPFDRFEGNMVVSEHRVEIHNGRLDRGSSQILFNAAAPLVHGEIPGDAPVSASAELRQWDVRDALALLQRDGSKSDALKSDVPVKGALRGAITAGGTLNAPSARGSLEITGGEAWGEKFDSAASNLVWSGHHIEANNIRIARGRARATGRLQFETDTKVYNFDLSAAGVAVEDFPRLEIPKYKLTGTADVQASGKGVWQEHHIAPTGQATVHLNNATLNGEAAGSLSLTAKADGANATLHFEGAGRAAPVPAATGAPAPPGLPTPSGTPTPAGTPTLSGRLNADVTMALHEPYAFSGKVQASALDLDSLVTPYIEDRVTITKHSQMDAEATVQGDIQNLDKLAGSADIRSFSISLHGIDLRNEGVWHIAYQNHIVKAEPMKLAGRDTLVTLQGSIGMPPTPAAQRQLDFRADGDMNVMLLQTLRPDLTASGKAHLRMSLLGTWDNPQFTGRAELEEAAIGSESFPSSLTHLNGALLFNRTGIRIEKLTGESGGGRLNLTGVLDYTRSPKTFQIRAEARGVRMRYPPGVSTVLDADLNLAGTPERSLLTGSITIQRAGINANFDLAEALAQVKQASAAPSEMNWARSLQLFVRVISAENIRFESGATRNLQAQFDLNVRGTLADPALLGKVTIQEGNVTFAGTHYTINRGEVQFLNPFRIDPVISLDVSTRKQQYDISIDFAGPLDKLRVNYRSDPPLPVPDIQLLLVLGRTPTSSGSAAANPALAQVGSNTILGDTSAATVNSRLGRFFGASSLKIDPQSGGPDTNPSARISVEQQVAPNVTFTLITAITNTQQQIVQVEWTISRRVSLLATRDQNGLFGVDFKFRKQIK